MKYSYFEDVTHDWAIFEKDSEADPHYRDTNIDGKFVGNPGDEGGVVGTSEWIWMSEDIGRRICAALEYFDGISTERIIEMLEEKSLT